MYWSRFLCEGRVRISASSGFNIALILGEELLWILTRNPYAMLNPHYLSKQKAFRANFVTV